MVPGIWIMSLAALPLIFSDGLWAVALWVALLTAGEVIWSPRSSSYAASMAPVGREGMFLMLSSWPTYLTKWPAGYFSGWLLAQYSPDCPSCKDSLDLFCAPAPRHGVCESYSTGEASCPMALPGEMYFGHDAGCAQTCHECPGWHGDSQALFLWVCGLSLVVKFRHELLLNLQHRIHLVLHCQFAEGDARA